MINASEARALSQLGYEEHLNFLENMIKNTALMGETSVIIRKLPYGNWVVTSNSQNPIAEQVIRALTNNGFRVSNYYNQAQFVDTGLKISWEVE